MTLVIWYILLDSNARPRYLLSAFYGDPPQHSRLLDRERGSAQDEAL